MTVLAENGVSAYAYSPKKAKLAVCGSGNSSKNQVAYLMASRLGLNINSLPLDSTDALALAICHGQLAINPMSAHLLPEKI